MEKQWVHRTPAEGRWIAQSGDLNRFLAVSADTGGAYAQWEPIVPPGGGPRLHVHSVRAARSMCSKMRCSS